MTLQAERLIPSLQHFGIHGSVRVVTLHAALSDCFMFEYIGTALGGVALETRGVRARELGSMSEHGVAAMRFMTVRAAHFSCEHRVTVREVEFTPLIQVTLKTTFRRLPRIDDRSRRSTALDMSATRTVASLATDFLCMGCSDAQTRVSRIVKATGNSRVTLRTFTTANKFRAGDLGRHHQCAI